MSMAESTKLDVNLKPYQTGTAIAHLDVSYRLEGWAAGAGHILAQISLFTASIPVCEFSAEGVTAFDEGGVLVLTPGEETDEGGPKRTWRASRSTRGTITLQYRVYPRVLPPDYRGGPYFDLRTEEGGMNGSGVTFMLLPEEKPCTIRLHWDLSAMPPGTRGVWCKGEGDVTVSTTPQLLAFSYYAVGQIKTWRTPENARFELHYLAKPNFDIQVMGFRIYTLFTCISTFFEDLDAPFKIFLRKDPFKHHGSGTALADSFMYGYCEEYSPTPDNAQNVLAHEIVHNWPLLEDRESDQTLYNEGVAEYYSIVLPWRCGLLSLEKVKDRIQERAQNYYANPLRDLSNEEAFLLYWKDRRAQRLPYGRGFFYLLSVDRSIRLASGGLRNLDNVVLSLLREQRKSGKKPACTDWVRLLSLELGRDAMPEFEAMSSGVLIQPDEAWFGGSFRIRTGMVREVPLIQHGDSELVESYIWESNPDIAEKEAIF
jgi:predicted metalloprotease with PDZ domain